MMYCKATLFGDVERMTEILAETSPRRQKALGRQVENYDDPMWKAVSRDQLYRGLLEKFRQNADLKAELLAIEFDRSINVVDDVADLN